MDSNIKYDVMFVFFQEIVFKAQPLRQSQRHEIIITTERTDKSCTKEVAIILQALCKDTKFRNI